MTDEWGETAMGVRSPETVTVVFGEEQFFPTRYNSFKVGPYTYTTTQMIGESMDDTIKRAYKFLRSHADKMFTLKHRDYLERLKAVENAKTL